MRNPVQCEFLILQQQCWNMLCRASRLESSRQYWTSPKTIYGWCTRSKHLVLNVVTMKLGVEKAKRQLELAEIMEIDKLL